MEGESPTWNCQNHDIRKSSSCCIVSLWTSFCFLKVNQQKKHNLWRSSNIFSRKHPTFCFWLRREGRQIAQYRPAILSNWQKQPLEVLQTHNFIKKRLQLRCFPVVKFLRRSILKNICIRLLLNWLYERYMELCFWTVVFKPSWPCNIIKIPVAFKSEL